MKTVFCLVGTMTLLIILFFGLFFVICAKIPPVVFNEIAWMGTKESPQKEWIELYNNEKYPLSLKGWKITSKNGLNIELKNKIPPLGYFLLERSSQKTLGFLKGDQIYKGSLKNQGDTLYLWDSKGNLVDLVDCSNGWFAGNNTTKQTMERKDPTKPGNLKENWQTSKDPGGTPKSKNSSPQDISSLINKTRAQIIPKGRINLNTPWKILVLGITWAIFWVIFFYFFKKKYFTF